MTEPTKEATHRLFYEAFHDWLEQWEKPDIDPKGEIAEALAFLAVELSDAHAAQRVAEALDAALEILHEEGWLGDTARRIRALKDPAPMRCAVKRVRQSGAI